MTALEFLDGNAVRRERLGGSLVVLGGGLWRHVHVADAGAAIEAGMAAGPVPDPGEPHLAVSRLPGVASRGAGGA